MNPVDRILEALLPRGPAAESIRGDLHQEFRERRQAGLRLASAWYVAQALSVIIWATFDRVRGRPWSNPRRAWTGGSSLGHRECVVAALRTLGFALRRIRRAPGFAVFVVLILALGIGANAVMFEVVDRLLLSPPQHIVDPDQVRTLRVRGLDWVSG